MEKVKIIVNDAGMFGLKLDAMAKYKLRDARGKDEAQTAWGNSNFGFNAAVHQWK